MSATTAPRLAAAALAAALAAAAPLPGRAAPAAPAAPPGRGDQGFVLALRAGWGLPGGDLSGELAPSLDDLVRLRTALWSYVGYRLSPRVRLGLFLEYAGVDLERAACAGECEGHAVRFGAGVQVHLAPRRRLDPWVGLGVGFEFLELEAAVDTDGDGTVDEAGERSYAGVQLPLVEAGVDLVLVPRFRIGPYAAFSPGQFTSVKVEAPGAAGVRTRIDDRAVHAWLEAGVRVSLLL